VPLFYTGFNEIDCRTSKENGSADRTEWQYKKQRKNKETKEESKEKKRNNKKKYKETTQNKDRKKKRNDSHCNILLS